MLKAFIVALCVGTILNLINQFEALFGDETLNLFKLALTYCVPFFVYLLGARSNITEPECKSMNNDALLIQNIKTQIDKIKQTGANIGTLASSVNIASQSRFEVASETQKNTEHMLSTSKVFDVSIKEIYACILRLSDDTSIVLSNFDELIQQVYQSAKWSEQNAKIITDFRERFSDMLKKVEAISDISKKTRLLSFNASIEAAKAGSFGRGFSVVADEIKNLSNNTERETEKIKSILSILDTSVDEISSESRNFQKTLLVCVKRISGDKGDCDDLKTAFIHALDNTKANIDDILHVATNLRETMQGIQKGMATLIEGAESSITGSAKNIEYSALITNTAQEIIHKIES